MIQTIKMKKQAWATQMMAADGLQPSNVVIKRNRNARKVSFSDPDDLAHFSRVLSSIESMKI